MNFNDSIRIEKQCLARGGSYLSKQSSRARIAYLESARDNGLNHPNTIRLSKAHDKAKQAYDYEVMSVMG